ncbi:unnamed protein product [Caenorhabditis angaria]|uniref:7TM GPCR serpentine receptor class x (Srx) domain-containing protein n=1 Tax=Caenorhabditis angaria TaxID=860376 RepID=A0A9P1IZA8_9PELO|nr:unnamed protein product [Caenorhabditis angaria]
MFADIVYQSGDQYIQSFEDIQAGILVFLPCWIGLLMVTIVIRGCVKLPGMQSSFGYLMKYYMIAGSIAPINMGVFYFFGVMMDIKFVINNSRIFGMIALILTPILQSQLLMISLNRFFALATPAYYKKMFELKYQRVFVFLCWSTPLIYTPIITYYNDCSYKFYHYGWLFTYVINEKCGNKLEIMLRGVQAFFAYSMVLVDIVTILLLICFRKKVLQSHSAQIRRREISFGQQVVIQGFVYMMYGFWYNLGNRWIPQSIPENWRIFWTTAFSANMLHIFGTSVIFIFNSEFSRWLRCYKREEIIVVSNTSN